MDIRPQDLPELRVEALLDQAARGDNMLWRWADVAKDYGSMSPPDFARKMWRYEIERLGSAELFFVSRAMVELAIAAAKTLPSFRITPEDLPARTGLMVFEEPLPAGIYWDDGDVSTTRALLWSCPTSLIAVGGMLATGYTDRDAFQQTISDSEGVKFSGPGLVCMPGATFASGFHDDGWGELHPGTSCGDLFPVLVAAWLLMQQPLALITEVEADRSARKRMRRANQKPASVRVIELRRAKGSGGPGESGRTYQHSWIVRGHWRNHWHPKREVHRPVWIAPHVKGPEGAPMIGGEKVYAWKR